MIEVRQLVHDYPDGTRALNGVDVRIADGERVAIIGQNGSGKSTLVAHFNGLLRPTSGEVRIDGQSTAGVRVAALAAKVGLAFQDPDRQIFAGRVRTEVAFGPRNLGLRGSALDVAVTGAMTAVGLAERRIETPTTSGSRSGSCSPSPRSSRWVRRPWSSMSRPPARTCAGSSGSRQSWRT